MDTSRRPGEGARHRTSLLAVSLAALVVVTGPTPLTATPVADEPLLRVTGVVLDATTNGPVAGARIDLPDRTAMSDALGRFELTLTAGGWPIEVSAKGYQSTSSTLEVHPGGPARVEILLAPAKVFHDEVNVTAPLGSARESASTIPVRPREVLSVAGGGENVFHVLQTLPGVTATEDFGSRIAVRGGGPDQNLTVIDGVEVYNPYRLYGFASAFNPETVEGFELTSGAFSARYGDRLSSLLVVETRDGTDKVPLTGSAALSLTDSNAIVEGRLPGGRGSWLLSGRRTYYDLVAERFTDNDLPSFADLQGKATLKLGGGRTLTLFGLRSRERTDLAFDVEDEAAKGAVDARTRNDLVSARFSAPLAGRGWARTVASSYLNTDLFDFGGDFRDETRRSNAPDESGFGTLQLGVGWNLKVRDRSLRQELAWNAGAHLLETGLELHRLRDELAFRIDGGRNTAEANGTSLDGGTSLPDRMDSRRSDTRWGAWLQDRWQLSARLTLEAGLRFDRSSINDRSSFTPRGSLTWALDTRTRLRGALGLHTQSPGYEKLVMGDYFVELAGTGPLPLANERSRHALVSLERDLAPGVLARVETYYKGFDRLLAGRLEAGEETAARLARYDFPADLAPEIPTDPAITSVATNDGRGRAWGFDLYVARRATSSATRLTGWASYAYGVAERDAYGRRFPFDYDRRHALSVVAAFRATPGLELSLTARLASGFPYTPVLGLVPSAIEDSFDLDGDGDREELVPERDPSGALVYTPYRGGVSNLNSARLPLYARIDARTTFTPGWGRGRVRLYVDLINVLARENGGDMETTLEHDPAADRPRLKQEPIGGMPFFPSFGVHVDFSTPKAPRAPARPGKGAGAPARPGRLALGLDPGGSTGAGVELLGALVPRRLDARVRYALPGRLKYGHEVSGTDYDVKLRLGSVSALVDWHPFAGSFHLSAGAFATRHAIDVTAKEAASYELGGVAYASEDVGRLKGTAQVSRSAPYVGIGWGNVLGSRKRFGMRFELGTVLQGTPRLRLAADGPAAADPAFQERLRNESGAVEKDLRFWRTFPVLSGGVFFRLR